MKADYLYASHPVARLLLGCGLLFLTIVTDSAPWCIFLILFAAIMLRLVDANWQTSIRVLRLLRWFVLPILLLHALFSPGQLLWPDFPIAIAREGLLRGGWLSLHLTAVFALAMLLFRLLKRAEWMQYILLLPRYGEGLAIQLLMILSMQQHMTGLLQHLRQQFSLHDGWKTLAVLLLAAFQQALADASVHAQMLWLRWPRQLMLMPSDAVSMSANVNRKPLHRYVASILCAVTGCAGFLLAWL